ncbi:TPA: hypothetical protein ACJB9M_000848 [Acinetobacter baumannii]
MTIQTVNLGSAPTGAGGDTFRSTGAKMNENFMNWSHAASRYVGTSAGNVMEVGVFGVGLTPTNAVSFKNLNTEEAGKVKSGFYSDTEHIGEFIVISGNFGQKLLLGGSPYNNGVPNYQLISASDPLRKDFATATVHTFHTSQNTTVDSNGFIKKASPIVKLYANKIELNDEAAEQNITFEKLDVGHYLVKGSSGFAKDGWWIEIPTDTHGNKICAVEYQTLENGDLEIKTFKKKLNDEGDIVANLDAPIDIPNNANGEPRWIDIRLNEIKKPVVVKTARTEKQPRMVQQVKYAPQLTYITKYEDLFDDEGKAVIVDGKNYKKPVTHIQTDQNGTPILSNQPVINENGEPVFEWVQAVDSEGNPVFDDVPVLDKDGNPIYDEVTYDPE